MSGENDTGSLGGEPLDATMSMSPQTSAFAEVGEMRAESLSNEAQGAVEALPAGTALLVVQRGPNAGARFLLDDDCVTAGRDPNCSIFLDDVTVSRRHAEFRITGTGFTVRDSGSLNGTYVNRERVEDVALSPGDEVQIGKYRMTYHPSRVKKTASEPDAS